MKIKSFKLVFSLTFISLVLASNCCASIKSQITSLINKSDQKKVDYGIYVIEASSGKSIYKKNHTTPLIPASNMKLVTTAAALDYLGCDYQFETKLGLCDNKLVIISSGDPLLGDEKTNNKHSRSRYWPLDDIVRQINDSKIKSLNGIIIDTAVFDDIRVHPTWPVDQLNKWYACEISGLNFNDNCVEVLVKNNNGRIYYYLEPQTNFLKITNQATPISKGNSAVGAYRTNNENNLYLKGRVNKSAQFTLAIERPAAFFGYILAERLISQDITMNGQIIEGPVPKKCDFKLLKTYKTPIEDVVERSNRDSLGLAAEALLKKIGCDRFGMYGSWQTGAQQVGSYLNKIGVSSSQFNIADGSGLSRENRLSPFALVCVMKNIFENQQKKDIILDSLSIGGVSGTAAKWFGQPEYKGKILLKTGYINGVRSYTGLCKTKKGDLLFSIITNNSNAKSRDTMNDILKTLIDYYE